MTLPFTSILPVNSEQIVAGGDQLESYIQDLVFNLQRQYEDVATAVNGRIGSNTDTGSGQYIPIIRGSTADGVGTYTSQIGRVLRQGILVDVWFNITWTGHTGTGNLRLVLPYSAAKSNGNLFSGGLWTQTVAFTGDTYGVIVDGTEELQVVQSRSGTTFANIAMLTAGTLRGHIRYVGKEEQ